MPTSNTEELGLFLKCTVIGRGVLDLAPAENSNDKSLSELFSTKVPVTFLQQDFVLVGENVSNSNTTWKKKLCAVQFDT